MSRRFPRPIDRPRETFSISPHSLPAAVRTELRVRIRRRYERVSIRVEITCPTSRRLGVVVTAVDTTCCRGGVRDETSLSSHAARFTAPFSIIFLSPSLSLSLSLSRALFLRLRLRYDVRSRARRVCFRQKRLLSSNAVVPRSVRRDKDVHNSRRVARHTM